MGAGVWKRARRLATAKNPNDFRSGTKCRDGDRSGVQGQRPLGSEPAGLRLLNHLKTSPGLVREEYCFGYFAHALAAVHAEALDAAEGLGFFEALRIHEHALGA